jgi:Heliorhodopsin
MTPRVIAASGTAASATGILVNGGMLLADVDLGVAVVVLLVFSAVCRAAAARWPNPVIRRAEWSQVSAVTVFLIAQLNGIQDVAALVALYALTAAASLFLLLHEGADHGRWPFAFGAAVGVVPWGVIAFYQIGAIVTGDGPAPVVRVITVVMLVIAAGYWFAAFRHSLSGPVHTVIVVAQLSVFAATIAAILWTV